MDKKAQLGFIEMKFFFIGLLIGLVIAIVVVMMIKSGKVSGLGYICGK